MKERSHNKDIIKKKKSNEGSFSKTRMNSSLNQQLKYLPSKYQPRVSTSLLDAYPPNTKETLKRVNSLDMGELSIIQQSRPSKSTTNNKGKKNIGHCFSERHMVNANSSNKLFKYRKFSSNAQLKQEEDSQHLLQQRRKLSLVQQRQQLEISQLNQKSKLSCTAWIVLIRKLFVDEYKKRGCNSLRLNLVVSYIDKLQKNGLKELSLIVESLDYEVQLHKQQVISILQSFFISKNPGKDNKTSKSIIVKLTFLEVINCFVQYQIKLQNSSQFKVKHKSSSSEEHQEVVETARFQEGGSQDESKKIKKYHQNHKQTEIVIPRCQTLLMKNQGKQNLKASLNMSTQNKMYSNASSRSRQSLNPSLSPFLINQSKSIQNSRFTLEHEESEPIIFKKGSFQCHQSSQSLGMLTLEGRSPRQLMGSEIYESMQKLGVSGQRNNISFSLQQLQVEPHISFEQTVHSFQSILKKIQNIQAHYQPKLNQVEDKNTDQVNSFLQQLIKYRMTMNSEGFGSDEGYSYFVGLSNISEFRQHNLKIMKVLLHSTYMKEYFTSLQGLKIQNSPQLLRSVSPLLHQGLRILNISKNNISDLSFLLQDLPDCNQMQLVNVSNNMLTNVTPLLKKFRNLKELHCQSNLINRVNEKTTNLSLKIIDLSNNKIERQGDLSGIITFQALQLLNLQNNPLVLQKDWKINWNKSININILYQMNNLYVMSAFGSQKDIAFSIESNSGKKGKQKLKNIEVQHEFTMTDILKPSPLDERQIKSNKSAGNQDMSRQFMNIIPKYSIKADHEVPKQKISKIKTYLDGKVI